jgi:hypothetical protein
MEKILLKEGHSRIANIIWSEMLKNQRVNLAAENRLNPSRHVNSTP